MSKNKFTPGLWKIAKCDKTFIYALNERGYNRFWCKLQANTHNFYGATQEELEANALLMCESKSLLSALEGMVSLYPDDMESTGSGILRGFSKEAKERVANAKKALAKARGEKE